MRAEFVNGTSVNRAWRTAENAELVAIFQYEDDAVEFAKTRLAQDIKRGLSCEYIVSNSYAGKLTILRNPTSENEASRQEGESQ